MRMRKGKEKGERGNGERRRGRGMGKESARRGQGQRERRKPGTVKGGGNDIRGFRVCLLNVVFMHTFGAPFPCEDYVLRKGGKTHHPQNMKTTFHEQPRKSLISIIYIYISCPRMSTTAHLSWELPVERPKKRIIETKWQLARWPPTRARSEPEEDIKLHYWSESGVGGRGRKPFNIAANE